MSSFRRRGHMLRGGISIGRVFGVHIRLHYTWFFIFALVTWTLATQYFPTAYPTWSLATSIAAGLITSLLFFGSVLLHELMHSRVAISEGLPVHSITLFILGGVSQITEEPRQPKDEFLMAIAGPLTSLVLGGIFWGIWYWLRDINHFIAAIAYWLGIINILLGVFNLIPGFPLDGGRVLRSLLWWRNKKLQSATRVASTVGRVIGYLFIFGGIWLLFKGNWFNGIWLALIGWFLESSAVGSYRQMVMEDMLKGHTVSEIMSRECSVVNPDITVEELVNENVLKSGRRCFPVISDNRVLGLMTLHNIKAVPRDRWRSTMVKEAMTNLENMKSVSPNDDLSSVLRLMVEGDINQVPVLQEANIVGMISRDNLLSFINVRGELGR
jgi:Zn-dependent protease/CBS domain-containing protein